MSIRFMCKEQKSEIVHEGPRTSASLLHGEKNENLLLYWLVVLAFKSCLHVCDK